MRERDQAMQYPRKKEKVFPMNILAANTVSLKQIKDVKQRLDAL